MLGSLQAGQRQEIVETMREPVLTRIPAELGSIQASSKTKEKSLTWSANILKVLLQHKQKFTSLESGASPLPLVPWQPLPLDQKRKVKGVDLWWGCELSEASWVTLTANASLGLGHRKLLSFISLVPTLIDMMLSFSHPVKENCCKFMASSLLIGDVIKAPAPPKERWALLITVSVESFLSAAQLFPDLRRIGRRGPMLVYAPEAILSCRWWNK